MNILDTFTVDLVECLQSLGVDDSLTLKQGDDESDEPSSKRVLTCREPVRGLAVEEDLFEDDDRSELSILEFPSESVVGGYDDDIEKVLTNNRQMLSILKTFFIVGNKFICLRTERIKGTTPQKKRVVPLFFTIGTPWEEEDSIEIHTVKHTAHRMTQGGGGICVVPQWDTPWVTTYLWESCIMNCLPYDPSRSYIYNEEDTVIRTEEEEDAIENQYL